MEAATRLDLKTFDFPRVTGVDIVFPTFDTIPELLQEAKTRGFDKSGNPYCELFRQLFYTGGKVKFKEGIDEEFKNGAWAYLNVLIGSYAPRHEDKESVCAMLLSELVEPELDKP